MAQNKEILKCSSEVLNHLTEYLNDFRNEVFAEQENYFEDIKQSYGLSDEEWEEFIEDYVDKIINNLMIVIKRQIMHLK